MFEDHAAQSEAKMRNLIFAINITLVAGEGRRLLEGISLEKLQLKLVESKIFKSGCVALRYLKQ
jgi:hypothetical protein